MECDFGTYRKRRFADDNQYKHVMDVLKDFEAEAFSLSIAYSLTAIIASCIYQNSSTNYASSVTDDGTISANGDSTDWFFFLVTVMLTFAVMWIQWYINRNNGRLFHITIPTAADGDVFLGRYVSRGRNPFADGEYLDALHTLLKLSIAYTSGCAWIIWSQLTLLVNLLISNALIVLFLCDIYVKVRCTFKFVYVNVHLYLCVFMFV